ncbi:MAG: thioredoxin family protein [Leptospirillia bacterium]
MALLETDNIPMGTPCPEFELPGVDGRTWKCCDDFTAAEVLVILFICNHCPYVVAIEDRMVALANHFEGQPVQFVGICANDPADYPADSFDNMRIRAAEKGYNFPYLQDISQQVAKDFGAVCTPDIFVYDRDRKLAYHGRFDDNWQEPAKVTQEDLKGAIQTLLDGGSPSADQVPSMGCSIKWTRG